MNLCLIVIEARCISVVLDDIHDEPRHGIQSKECVVVIPCSHALDVAVHARFSADTEKERRNIFHLQNAFLR